MTAILDSNKRFCKTAVILVFIGAFSIAQLFSPLNTYSQQSSSSSLSFVFEPSLIIKNISKKEVNLSFKAATGVRQLEFNSQRNNTNWKNVHYNSGVFGRTLSREQDKLIIERCNALAAVQYHDSPISMTPLNETSINNTCFQPLPTNTTCCFCYVSKDGEEIRSFQKYRYWSCAVPRENSLLPANATSLDSIITQGGAKVAFLTGKFGHNNSFEAIVKQHCQNVKDMNLFDPKDIMCFWDSPDYVLQNKKFSRHLRYRTDPNDMSARGGGYWIHKVAIIRHYLDLYQGGDFLVWTDVDRFEVFPLGTFHAVIDTMVKGADDLGIEVMSAFKEKVWTKGDVLAAFNASQSNIIRNAPQVSANFIVIRNSPSMKRLVNAWVECVSDWHMVSDERSILPNNAPVFAEHRHDQSILGLLIKSFMKVHSVVGPPARPLRHLSEIATYKFQGGADPSCPFSSFYAERFMAQQDNKCKK